MLTRVNGPPTSGRSRRDKLPGIDAFDHGDSRIASQLPVQLVVADIERDHVPRAALQPDIGESAGGCADVDHVSVRGIDVKGVERKGELDAAAADPRVIRADHSHIGVNRHHGAGLVGAVTGDIDLSGKDQRTRLFARLDETALHEQRVTAGRAELFDTLVLAIDNPASDVREPRLLETDVPERCSRRARRHSAASCRDWSTPKNAG